MTESLRAFRHGEQPEDDAAREARHQLLANLLGAYADGELPAETASQIDAHLLGCGRCRSELKVQQAVSERLSRSTIPAATAALQSRIRLAIAAAPAPTARTAAPVTTPSTRFTPPRWLLGVLGVVSLAVLALFAVMTLRERATVLDPAPLETQASVPPIQHVLQEYRRVSQGDLPGRARDLESVRRSLPFPVTPLTESGAHLLAAWTTDFDGEPAAVLAYRWRDRVVMQFVVGEAMLFRTRALRDAFAARQAVVTQDGEQGLIAWPEADAGSLLVGDLAWKEMVPLSTARKR